MSLKCSFCIWPSSLQGFRTIFRFASPCLHPRWLSLSWDHSLDERPFGRERVCCWTRRLFCCQPGRPTVNIILSRQENTKQVGDICPDVQTEPEAAVEQMMQTCVKPTWVQRRKPDENLLSLCQFKLQVLAVCPILLSSGVIPALPLLAK